MDEILAGRLIFGMLIVIFRFTTGAAGADFDALTDPLLLDIPAGCDAFLISVDFAETFLLLTFLVAPLVAVLDTVFLAGFPLATVLAAFFLEAVFGGAFFLVTFDVVDFFPDDIERVFKGFFACFFLLTLPTPAEVFELAFLPAALGDVFLWLLPAAFLVTAFFRATMLSVPAFAQSRVSAKWRIIHSHPALGSAKLWPCQSNDRYTVFHWPCRGWIGRSSRLPGPVLGAAGLPGSPVASVVHDALQPLSCRGRPAH